MMTMRFVSVILLGMTSALAAHAAPLKTAFGTLPDGAPVHLYTLKGPEIEVAITDFGARVVAIKTPDRSGKMADVVLGYSSVDGYLAEKDKKTYFGAIVGRYGNRIAHGQFTIDGKSFQVPKNNGENALHGGPTGFDLHVWKVREIPDGLELTLVSPDGDQGFPGALTAHVRYTLHGHTLRIDFSATTDKPTVVNLTNHSYFNLSGEDSGTILGEKLMINASGYTPVDAGLIPSGGVRPVAGTPFDFTHSTTIGDRINDANEQLKIAGGYDHNFALNGKAGEMKLAAKLTDPVSGRTLTVQTTEPGVQFYSGNFLDGTYHGKTRAYPKNAALCLETQHFPDSPNQAAFSSTELRPGHTLHSTTTFTFGVEK